MPPRGMPASQIDLYAPIVASALKATGVDIPLEVVKERLASPKAKLVLPDPNIIEKVRNGELGCASVETVQTEEVVTSARDFGRSRPLSVRVKVSPVSKKIRGLIR